MNEEISWINWNKKGKIDAMKEKFRFTKTTKILKANIITKAFRRSLLFFVCV